jgi:DNA repair protein RadA
MVKKATDKKEKNKEVEMPDENLVNEEDVKKELLKEMLAMNRTPEEIEEIKKDEMEVEAFDISKLDGVGTVRKTRLNEAGIFNAMDIVTAGPMPLAELTGMEVDATAKMVRKAREFLENSGVIRNSFMKASEVLEYRDRKINSKRLKTGSLEMDKLLGGGIEPQAVTEFYGVYGCGKTQICHSLAVIAQLPKEQGGLSGEVIWIDTENTFRPERIRDIVLENEYVPIQKRKKTEIAVPVNELDVTKFLDKIMVARATSASHQDLILEQLSRSLQLEDDDKKEGDPRVVLVIVDSLTTHFRSEYLGRGLLAPRQAELGKFLHKIARIAEVYNIAVVVTNQVLANPDGFGAPIKAVGGNIVAHTSTYRIWLRKGAKSKRIAKMDDSPQHAQNEAVFATELCGVCDIKE